jgi:hypothetical protein
LSNLAATTAGWADGGTLVPGWQRTSRAPLTLPNVTAESGKSPEKDPVVRTHFKAGNAPGAYTVLCQKCGEVGQFHDPVAADQAVAEHRRDHRAGSPAPP